MDVKITETVSSIQKTWSETERRRRRELAGAIQLQLKALATLSALSEQRKEARDASTAVASAC